MSTESPKQPSEARLAANRNNALKSTGPRTAQGKAISRVNAIKHGFCAAVIQVPGEDQEAVERREVGWQAELNPFDREVQGYVVHFAVRQTLRLDRLHATSEARLAGIARNILKDNKEKRLRDVEEIVRMDRLDADIMLRRLRRTSEGCDHMLAEWDAMRCVLTPDPAWDNDDLLRFHRLLGRRWVENGESPTWFAPATITIMQHRELAKKLRKAEPPSCYYHAGYTSQMNYDFEVKIAAELRPQAEEFRLRLLEVVETQTAAIRLLRDRLLIEEAAEPTDVLDRAKLDTSDDERLMRRYEIEAQRSLFRCLKEVQTLNKLEGSRPQELGSKEFEAIISGVEATGRAAPVSRNEPKPDRSGSPFADLPESPRGDYSYVPINIVPEPRPKNQR